MDLSIRNKSSMSLDHKAIDRRAIVSFMDLHTRIKNIPKHDLNKIYLDLLIKEVACRK